MNVSSSEIITAPTVAFSSGGATHTTQVMTGSEQSFTSSYVTQTGHTEGEIGFTISAFDDQAGNTGNNVSAITSGSILYLDKTKPTITSSTVTSNNPTNTLAKEGNTVTLAFE